MPYRLPQSKALSRMTRSFLAAGTHFRGRFRHLSIGKKLAFSFGALVLLTFLAVGRTYLSNARANASIRHAQEVRMPTALTSVSAQANLLRMLADLSGYMVTGESSFRDRYQRNRQNFEAELLKMADLLQSSNPNGTRLVQLQQVYEEWSSLPEQLFRLRDTPLENQPALALLESEGRVPMELVANHIAAMLVAQQQQPAAANVGLISDLANFQSSFAKLSTGVQSYLVTQNPSFRYDYTEALQANQAAWERLQEQRAQLSRQQQQRMDAIATQRRQFLELPARLFAIAESAQRRQDLYLLQQRAEPLALEMIEILDEIVAAEQQLLLRELRTGQREQAHAQWQTLSVGIVALFTGAVMALVLQRQILDPIQRLTRATTQIKDGYFGVKATVESRDEIGALAAAFNHMSDSLWQSRQALERYSQTLEQRVTERTQELQGKNYQLETLLRDLRETQAQLIQTEKMSGLGQMVAGVAHEINNPVNFIYGNLKHAENYAQDLMQVIALYQQQYPHPDPALAAKIQQADLEFVLEDLPKTLNSMQVGATRIREIVMTLRNFARIDEVGMKEADLHCGLDSTLMLLQAKLKQSPGSQPIQVVKDLGQIPPVPCYPGQLNQVLMNILANAIDALEAYELPPEKEAKVITIETRCVDQQAVTIRIRDNGPGMDTATQRRLFDPFFTTKQVGRGTGLGLSISHQIVVNNHNGQLTCQSTLGVGTVFTMAIPLKGQKFPWSETRPVVAP